MNVFIVVKREIVEEIPLKSKWKMSFEAVDKSNREFERCYNNGQVKEAVQSYTNDARLFATDKQVYEGLTQIEKYYTNARSSGSNKVELHTGQVIQCGSDHLVEIRFDRSSSFN